MKHQLMGLGQNNQDCLRYRCRKHNQHDKSSGRFHFFMTAQKFDLNLSHMQENREIIEDKIMDKPVYGL